MPLDVKASADFYGAQFTVTNESDFDWENITFVINEGDLSSGYISYRESLKRGETYTTNASEFADNDGIRFDLSTMKPLRLSIIVHSSQGQSGTSFITWK